MRDFVSRHGLDDVVQLPDLSGDLWQYFGVRSQPSWLIIPADGSEPELVFGALGEDDFERYARA